MVLQQLFLERVVLSILVGALIGLERQYSKHQEIVGLRTFALISLLGALCVLLSDYFVGDILIALGFIAICIFSIFFYIRGTIIGKGKGFTTNIALIIAYTLGVLAGFGLYAESIFLSITVAVLLFSKERLHHLVKNLTEKEVGDLLEFLILLGIIYPIIPNTITWHGITIPLFTIWALIVLISLVNFAIFISARHMSSKHEIETLSFLGGIVGSTATTASLVGLFKKDKKIPAMMVGGFLLVNAAMLLRNFLFVSITVPETIKTLALPIAISIICLVVFAYLNFKKRKKAPKLQIKSPFNVLHGLKLGLAILVLYVILNFVKDSVGNQALFLTAFLGGLVESSATTLSLISLFSTGFISIVVLSGAIIANLIGSLVSNQLVCIFYKKVELVKRSIIPITISIVLLAITSYLIIVNFL